MNILRAYADTSVFGGVFDDEFKDASQAFFKMVRDGRFRLLVSDLSRREIDEAPPIVRSYYDDLLEYMQFAELDARALALRDAYVAAGVVGPRSMDDAAHVAIATVDKADLIVSWNFRHIVHFEKIRHYNQVNAVRGYGSVEIRSPLEVLDYEDEDV